MYGRGSKHRRVFDCKATGNGGGLSKKNQLIMSKGDMNAILQCKGKGVYRDCGGGLQNKTPGTVRNFIKNQVELIPNFTQSLKEYGSGRGSNWVALLTRRCRTP